MFYFIQVTRSRFFIKLGRFHGDSAHINLFKIFLAKNDIYIALGVMMIDQDGATTFFLPKAHSTLLR
ncbi:hypothetical protein JCM19231_4814 [Vibrio ishigakensis]|uniref:Uncharacterized protein n=1 Tax=Vibrio ishigakensis TaxID=1481914 RepID=A0A0B8NW96_9VIBR|nr:hypothetical protein JCM19231_4814 [Vibrio ishigakensis]